MDEVSFDPIVFVDDDGNEFEMEIVERFDHNGKKYALLAEADYCDDPECEHDHEHEGEDDEEQALYIFEVVSVGEEEEFMAVEDDALLDELIQVVESLPIFDEE